MDLVVYDDDEKRYVPWAVALAAVLLVALLTALLTFLLARRASGSEAEQAVGGVSAPEPATAPTDTASPTASAAPPSPAAPAAVEPAPAPGCVAALLRADAALERSVAVDEALAQHTAIMDELLAERITPQEALDRTLPVLTDGSTERRRFEEAVTAYQEARQECPS